ncbi:MAG: DUF362 domain-containing protein [bacterium]
MTETTNNRTQVVVVKHEDKFTALERVLTQTGFWDRLEQKWQGSGKSKQEFLIVIKPNISMGHSRKDLSPITDKELVERLVDDIAERGFSNIAVVDAQNVYGNWYHNREVLTVARYFGYSEKNYRLVDLTEEMVSYDYGGRLGKHKVGPTWRDADFRISFAKNKTHASCFYTLTVKNTYGCLPMQNKFKEYHKKREFDWPTIESLKTLPCHFGLIDAFVSADGLMGVKADYTPKKTETIIGGENIIAVDWVGAQKMGLDPSVSSIFRLATDAFGMPEVDWEGDKSKYKDWVNVPPLMDKIMDVGEESYIFTNWIGLISSNMDPFFRQKMTHKITRFIQRVMRAILKFISRVEG